MSIRVRTYYLLKQRQNIMLTLLVVFFVDIDMLGKRRYNYRKESWSLLKIILLTCYYKLIGKSCSKEFIFNKIEEKILCT